MILAVAKAKANGSTFPCLVSIEDHDKMSKVDVNYFSYGGTSGAAWIVRKPTRLQVLSAIKTWILYKDEIKDVPPQHVTITYEFLEYCSPVLRSELREIMTNKFEVVIETKVPNIHKHPYESSFQSYSYVKSRKTLKATKKRLNQVIARSSSLSPSSNRNSKKPWQSHNKEITPSITDTGFVELPSIPSEILIFNERYEMIAMTDKSKYYQVFTAKDRAQKKELILKVFNERYKSMAKKELHDLYMQGIEKNCLKAMIIDVFNIQNNVCIVFDKNFYVSKFLQ